MPYAKPFSKIYLQFYSSIESVIYDFAPKKELFYDPNLSVFMGVGELFRWRFFEEENIHHREFSFWCFLRNDCCACVVDLANSNAFDHYPCSVVKYSWVTRNADSFLQCVSRWRPKPPCPIVLVAMIGRESNFYSLICFRFPNCRERHPKVSETRPSHCTHQKHNW